MPITNKITHIQQYIALIIATLSLAINFWAWSLLSPLGGRYVAELRLDPIQLSVLLAAPIIIGSLGRIPLGIVVDKIGGRKIFAGVSIVMILPVLGLMVVDSYQALLILSALLGIGGASFVAGVPYLSSWFKPERRGFVLGIYSIGNAGSALSGLLTPRLSDIFGRNFTFAFVGVMLAVMAMLITKVSRDSPNWKPNKDSGILKFTATLRTRLTWDLSLVYCITFGAFVAFGVYLPTLLSEAYDLSLTDAASRAAGFIALATIARPLGGWLSDIFGGQQVIKAALVATAFLSYFTAFQPTLELHTTIAYLSLAFTLGCANGAVFALIGRLAPKDSIGSVTGVVGALGGLGGFLPPLILGFFYKYTNSYAPALVMLALCSMLVFIYVILRFVDNMRYYTE